MVVASSRVIRLYNTQTIDAVTVAVLVIVAGWVVACVFVFVCVRFRMRISHVINSDGIRIGRVRNNINKRISIVV